MEERVVFETVGKTTVCIRCVAQQSDEGIDSIKCTIYAAESMPYFIGENQVDFKYNLVDIDDNVVIDFKDAFEIAEVNSFIINEAKAITRDELIYSVTFPENMFMIGNQFEEIFTIINFHCTDALIDFYNDVKEPYKSVQITEEIPW